jgi:hypothetical protein
MKVRRTGAKRGQSPTWYVWADQPSEQAAIKAGLLEEQAPDLGYRYILVWGCRSQQAARQAMERIRLEVEQAVALIMADDVASNAQVVLARLFHVHGQISERWAALNAHAVELGTVVHATRLDHARLSAVAEALCEQIAITGSIVASLTDVVQMACLLCSMADNDDPPSL